MTCMIFPGQRRKKRMRFGIRTWRVPQWQSDTQRWEPTGDGFTVGGVGTHWCLEMAEVADDDWELLLIVQINHCLQWSRVVHLRSKANMSSTVPECACVSGFQSISLISSFWHLLFLTRFHPPWLRRTHFRRGLDLVMETTRASVGSRAFFGGTRRLGTIKKQHREGQEPQKKNIFIPKQEQLDFMSGRKVGMCVGFPPLGYCHGCLKMASRIQLEYSLTLSTNNSRMGDLNKQLPMYAVLSQLLLAVSQLN